MDSYQDEVTTLPIRSTKLTFVYNANSGALNTWLDIGHKLLRPDTYSCNLCALTHGILKEKTEWRKYKEESQLDIEFLHKDEFEIKYNKSYDYPIVLSSKKTVSLK